MATTTLTLLGATQFANVSGGGAFPVSSFNHIARTTRLAGRFTYTEILDNPITTNIWFFAQSVQNPPPVIFLLGRGQWEHGLIDPVDGNAYLKLCFDVIPRHPADAVSLGERNGNFWNLYALSTGKQNDGTVTFDVDTCPSPDTSKEDSR